MLQAYKLTNGDVLVIDDAVPHMVVHGPDHPDAGDHDVAPLDEAIETEIDARMHHDLSQARDWMIVRLAKK